MIESFIHNRRARFLFAAGAISLCAIAFYYFGGRGLSYKELIIVSGGLVGGVILFGRELGIRYGFILWIFTLALGYRTISITPELPVHPSELLLWLLLACILVQRRLAAEARMAFPVWLWMFIPFCVLAWWPLISGNAPWDRMLNEFRNFVLLIPLLIVASTVLQQKRYWRLAIAAFFITSSWIALMGVLEYWAPEVANMFPAFLKNAKPTITEEGFARAQFSFWGGPLATFICVLALPGAIALAKWSRRSSTRALVVAGAILQLLAVYIGGYRSIWFVVLIQVVVLCIFGLKKQGAIVALLLIVVAFGGYQLVPRTSERAMSAIAAIKGQPTDSSATGRRNRAMEALETVAENPFGSGWSKAGWVHSDFLQVAVNLGVLGGLIFLAGYCYTLLRLGRRVIPSLRSGQPEELGLSILLLFIGVGGLLALEGVSVLPQIVLPAWFGWALTEIWLRQTSEQRETVRAIAPVPPYNLLPIPASPSVKADIQA